MKSSNMSSTINSKSKKSLPKSAKPTPKSSGQNAARLSPLSEQEWAYMDGLFHPGGTANALSEVTADFSTLQNSHRKQRNILLVKLYEIARHVRIYPAAYEELRLHDGWKSHDKFRPQAADQENALGHVFRLAAGFDGPVSNDRSSRWTRALTPAFLQNLTPAAVLDLIEKGGGIKKLASQNKAKGKNSAQQPDDMGVGNPPAAGKGCKDNQLDGSPESTDMAAVYLQHLRHVEEISITYFLSDYAGLSPLHEGQQRQFFRRLLEDRMVRLTNGADPSDLLLDIYEPVLRA